MKMMKIDKFRELTPADQLKHLERVFNGSGSRVTKPIYLRQTGLIEDSSESDEFIYSGVASATAMDRDGFYGINVTGGDLTNYLRNPKIFLMHEQSADVFPIGESLDIGYTDEGLRVRFRLFDDYDKAVEAKEAIDRGSLSALSIQYTPVLESYRVVDDSIIFDRWDLIEVSVVGVGEDPLALIDPKRAVKTGDDVVMLKSDRKRFLEGPVDESPEVKDEPVKEDTVEDKEEDIEEPVEEKATLEVQVEELTSKVAELTELVTEQRTLLDSTSGELEKERKLRRSENTALAKRINGLSQRTPTVNDSDVLEKIEEVSKKFK